MEVDVRLILDDKPASARRLRRRSPGRPEPISEAAQAAADELIGATGPPRAAAAEPATPRAG